MQTFPEVRERHRLIAEWAETVPDILTPRQREVVALVYVDETHRSIRDAARKLGVHTSTIRQHLTAVDNIYAQGVQHLTIPRCVKLIKSGTDPRDIRIGRLLLPVRIRQALYNDGLIETVMDLLAVDPKRLMKMPNFGQKSYSELRRLIEPLYLCVSVEALTDHRATLDPKYAQREEVWRKERLAYIEKRQAELDRERADLEAQAQCLREAFEERRQGWIKDTMNPEKGV